MVYAVKQVHQPLSCGTPGGKMAYEAMQQVLRESPDNQTRQQQRRDRQQRQVVYS